MVRSELPLEGMLVVDVSRMLPGAVLARQLIDLGARLIKVEEPGTGDPMRMVPPIVDGVGIGFQTLLRGAESVCLDLTRDDGRARFAALARRADVVIESFRPGTMSGWGLGSETLTGANPRLVWCSLSSFGRAEAVRHRLAHDLNLIALTGALEAMGPDQPRLQLADVSAGLLAASSVLAALLRRQRTGSGGRVDQPLLTGPLPFMTWRWAEAAAGREEVVDLLLGGGCPCYRTYRCGDGARIAVSALEAKFWLGFVTMLGAGDLDQAGFAMGDDGCAVVERVEEILDRHPRSHWLAIAEQRGLPVSAVHDAAAAGRDAVFADAGVTEQMSLPGGGAQTGVGPWLPDAGRTPAGPAPLLGEHTDAVLTELE
ncbi:MAG: CaiB/BaiF CoA-transferase family protein [Holophagae bacterium]|jgi:crotonobetainyl-CoA:carnitine CoA-transferase CaiB-like acyl-CoA transferase